MADPEDTTPLPGLRPSIEAAIERLIAYLDDLDDDPDLEEPGDLEPSLGWPENARWSLGGTLDLEDEHDGCEPDVDYEPSLGWRDHGSQLNLIDGNLGCEVDREEECQDEGAELLTQDVPREYKAVRDRPHAQAVTREAVAYARARRHLAQRSAAPPAGGWVMMPASPART